MTTAAQTVTRNAPGDRLTENAGNGQSGDSRPLNRGPAATSRVASRQNVSQLGKQGKSSFSHTKNQFLPRYRPSRPMRRVQTLLMAKVGDFITILALAANRPTRGSRVLHTQ